MKVIHHFADPQIGMVQTRWTHLNRNYSFLTEVEAILLDGHFVLEHGGRSRAGVFFNFNGTAGMWRRKAIDDAGGWEHDTLTEDTDLSYRSQLKGWKFRYLQDVECPAELPIEMTAFKTQQARWAKGLIQCAKKDLPKVLRAKVSRREKIEAWYHLTANLSYPLMIVLSVLLLPAMVIRFYQGWFQMLYIDIPLFLASTFSISSFYLVSQKELFPKTWYRTFIFLPALMALGIGLTLTNSKAVIEALIGHQSAFARTPKYRVVSKQDKNVAAKKYRKRLGWVPYIEMLVGGYFALTVWYAIANENYITVPFLFLFVFGYWYTGLMSLLQGRFDALVRARPKSAAPSRSRWGCKGKWMTDHRSSTGTLRSCHPERSEGPAFAWIATMHAVANLTGSGHDHQDALLSRHQQQVLRSGQDDKVEGNRIVMRQPAGFWPFRILLLLACFSLSSHALDRQPNADYHARRVALAQKLDGGVAVIFAATEAEGPNATFGFRQDDNFFYLSGLTEPGAALVVAPTFNKNSSAALHRDPVPSRAQPKTGEVDRPEAGAGRPAGRAVTGFDRVANLDTLSIELAKLLAPGRPTLCLDMPESGEQNAASAFLDWSRRANTLGLGTRVNDVKPALHNCALSKMQAKLNAYATRPTPPSQRTSQPCK